MKFLVRAALAAVLSMTLCAVALAASVTPARAATGTFVFKTLLGPAETLVDPLSGVCIGLGTTSEPVVAATNNTEELAFMYASADCTGGPSSVLNSGESNTYSFQEQIQSLRFPLTD